MDMERIFKDFLLAKKPVAILSEKTWSPPTDVFETKSEVVIKMEIAGVRKEGLEVSIKGDTLIIEGKRQDLYPAGKINFQQMEINYGHFRRVIRFSRPFESDKIKASYKEGFLIIEVPKILSRNISQTIPVEEE